MTLFPQFEPVMASAPPPVAKAPRSPRVAIIASALAVVAGIGAAVVVMNAGTEIDTAVAAVEESRQEVASAEAALEGHRAEATQLAIDIAGLAKEVAEHNDSLKELNRLVLGYDVPTEGSELEGADYQELIASTNAAILQAEDDRAVLAASLDGVKAQQGDAEAELAVAKDAFDAQEDALASARASVESTRLASGAFVLVLVALAGAMWIRFARRR